MYVSVCMFACAFVLMLKHVVQRLIGLARDKWQLDIRIYAHYFIGFAFAHTINTYTYTHTILLTKVRIIYCSNEQEIKNYKRIISIKYVGKVRKEMFCIDWNSKNPRILYTNTVRASVYVYGCSFEHRYIILLKRRPFEIEYFFTGWRLQAVQEKQTNQNYTPVTCVWWTSWGMGRARSSRIISVNSIPEPDIGILHF